MRMPQGDRAWVPAEKLEHYLLDETHPEGRNKATIFRSLLGITLENREVFERALLEAAATGEVRKRTGTAFGTKYEIEFPLKSARGEYTVVSVWIVPDDEHRPRLVTAYVR